MNFTMDRPGPSSEDTSDAMTPAAPQLGAEDVSRIAAEVASILRGTPSSSHPLTTSEATGSASSGN